VGALGLLMSVIMGIETSCDETSVALVSGEGVVLANLIASQVEQHRPFGGVVPEIASREHLRRLMPLVEQVIDESDLSHEELAAIAVTAEPGLIGALLVGVAGAQGLCYGWNLPIIPVNHLEAHLYSAYLRSEGAAIPVADHFMSIVVSGGHSSIYDVRGGGVFMLNRTRDDAAGEVFDKVAKFIGLPYPGGPHIERFSSGGNAQAWDFPLPRFKDESIDFSFSGLKAHAIRIARREGIDAARPDQALRDFCASFQRAICDQIEDRLSRAWEGMREQPSEICLTGGVAANGALRERVAQWADSRGLTSRLPEKVFCTDNGAMIAFCGWQHFNRGEVADPKRVSVLSRAQAGERNHFATPSSKYVSR
jgi:N6-L-threonylcarbamoyladenine synthase